MRREYTTAELKALGFSQTMIGMLYAAGTRDLGIRNLGDGYKVRQYTNVFTASSIARDVANDDARLERFKKLLTKRGLTMDVIEGLADEIEKTVRLRTQPPMTEDW